MEQGHSEDNVGTTGCGPITLFVPDGGRGIRRLTQWYISSGSESLVRLHKRYCSDNRQTASSTTVLLCTTVPVIVLALANVCEYLKQTIAVVMLVYEVYPIFFKSKKITFFRRSRIPSHCTL